MGKGTERERERERERETDRQTDRQTETHTHTHTYTKTDKETHTQTLRHTHTHKLEMVQRQKPIKKSPFTSLFPCYHSDGLERCMRAGIKLRHFLKGLNKIISSFIRNKAERGLLLDVMYRSTTERIYLPTRA